MSIMYQQGPVETEMAKLKFMTPNIVNITLDLNKVLSVESTVSPLEICNLQHKT